MKLQFKKKEIKKFKSYLVTFMVVLFTVTSVHSNNSPLLSSVESNNEFGADVGNKTTTLSKTKQNLIFNANSSTNSIPLTLIADPSLTITLGKNPQVCKNTTSTSISYTNTTGAPQGWDIIFDAAALAAGISNQNGSLANGSIPLNLPWGLSVGVYHANLTVKKWSGASSAPYAVTITVLESPLNWTPNISGSNQTICFNSSTGIMTLDSNYTSNVVRWEKRLNSGTWMPITTTLRSYSEIPSAAGTWQYRTVHGNSTCGIVYSNPFTVVVNTEITIALGQNPVISQPTSIVYLPYTATTGSPDEWFITFDAAAGMAGFTVNQNNNNNSNIGLSSGGAGQIQINVPYNVAPGIYRGDLKVIKNHPLCSSVSYPMSITVNGPVNAGTISGNQTICEGSQPSNISVSGASGTIQWQSSTNNSTWTNILGANSSILSSSTIGSISVTTYFRAVVKSGLSVATSGTSTVTVIPNIVASVNIIASQSTICSGSNVIFTATPTNGGYAPVYQWKVNGINAGTNSNTFSSNNLSDNDAVTVVMTYDANLCSVVNSTVSNTIVIIFTPSSVGGMISGESTVCSGSTSGLLTLNGYTGNIIRWESAVSPFTSWNVIANTSSTYISGNLTETTKFRAVVQSGLCSIAYSNEVTMRINTTIWDGVSWDNGTPTIESSVIVTADYTATATVNACTLLVKNNANVIISSGNSAVISGALTVMPGSSFTLENNANLLQNGRENLNSGNIKVKRFSSKLKRQDYVLWSSPTTGSQTLLAFSPETLTNRFYNYNTSTDLYAAVASPSTTAFDLAKGYLIRMPNTHPSTPTAWEQGAFVGTPNSGDYTFLMVDGGERKRFNLVGNPYPSPINAIDLVKNETNATNITSTLYFWRKTNDSTKPSYSTWTTMGFSSNGVYDETGVIDPNDVIQVGQGFFVEATGNGADLKFNNDMRVDNHANQFFRTANIIERHRIWLNATNADGLFSQTLVGYASDASNDLDATDGKFINDGAIALTSIINEIPYTIQGRSLPFNTNDVVPLQFKAAAAGAYSIAIDHVDGLFSGEQTIYLRDALTGLDYDLKSGEYSFTTEAGTFVNRFSLVYTAALSINNPILDANEVVIYKNENQSFVINSGGINMSSVKVFDIRGRLILSKNNINSSETIITAGQSNEVLLVQVTSTDGATITKKVVR